MPAGPTAPRSLAGLLAVFRPRFTAPTFHTFVGLVVGLIAQTRRRTVCGMLVGAGLDRVWHHSRAHRLFTVARWSTDALGLVLADLIVAHNAKFDRPFCERLCSDFARKAWACSATEIPWRSFGMEGAKLGTLLAAAGYFHDGHRALADCSALLRILMSPAAEGRRSPFQHLLLSARAFR